MSEPGVTNKDDLTAVKNNMNRMYQWTRHVYDITRKYYLLGRDQLIRDINAQPGQVVIEVGCGTARNLIKMAKRYPKVAFYGLDASETMLITAREQVAAAGLSSQIKLAHGFAQNFDPQTLFGHDFPGGIDKIVFSYSLSMIPPWQESIDHALALLKNDGEICIVDFGDQHGLPQWFRRFLFWWLDLFGVHFRPELPKYLAELHHKGLRPTLSYGLRGYYFLSFIRG